MTTQQILQEVHDWTNGKIVYDISVAHPDGQGNPTPYADLASALGNGGANIPEPLRKGGISVKFIKGSAQSSDNKYVQYRLTATAWSTTVSDWQGVDDEPTAGSKNLVTSGGVYLKINQERQRAELAEQNLQDNIDTIKDETLQENREMVNSIMENYAPVEITGDVNNAADEEDLTSVNVEGTDVLKFKDKVYNPLVYSGLGRKILRKNIVNGVNTLTQSMISDDNTIYVIQYDYEIDSANDNTITIPANSVLKFEGGSLSNGTIVGTGTLIEETKTNIFGTTTLLTGTWANTEIYPEWFGAVSYNSNNPVSCVSAFRAMNINMPLCKIYTIKLNSIYYIDDEVEIKNPNGKTIVNIVGTGKETSGFYYHIVGETKYALKISQGSAYGVNNSVYRDFFIQSIDKPNTSPMVVSTTKGAFYLENHIGSICENIRIYSCRVSEGAYVMAVTSGNIFNNRFVDCQANQIYKAYGTGGHGLKYSVTYDSNSSHAWFPIMQTIVNCRFHSCQGCGIVTDVLPIQAAGFSGVIANCDTESCAEGAMFFGGIINLKVINGYYEGYQSRSVDGESPLSPFTFGLLRKKENENYNRTYILQGLYIEGLNVGHILPTSEQNPHNVDYAVYVGNDYEPNGSVLCDIEISGLDTTNAVDNIIYLPMNVGKCNIGIASSNLNHNNVKFIKGANKIYTATITKGIAIYDIVESNIVERYLNRVSNVGTFYNKPDARNVYKGYEYLCTDWGSMIVWEGTRWVNKDGFSASPVRGTSDNRPLTVYKIISGANLPANTENKEIFVGFTYKVTSGENAGFWVVSAISNTGQVTWVREDTLFVGKTAEEIAQIQEEVKRTGTNNQRPSAQYIYENLYEGYAYLNVSTKSFEKAYASKVKKGDTYGYYVDWVPATYPFPVLFSNKDEGFCYYDTTIKKEIHVIEIRGNATMAWADALGNPVDTVYPKVIGTPTAGNLAKFNGTNIEDAGKKMSDIQLEVTGTNGNFAGFDTNGKLADSGSKASDFEPAQ